MEHVEEDDVALCGFCKKPVSDEAVKMTLRIERDGSSYEITFGSMPCLERWIAKQQVELGGARTGN